MVSGAGVSVAAFRAAERFIRFHVEREIALHAWGDVGEFRKMLPQDKAIRRALELLAASTSTSALLETAVNPEYSDWVPVPGEPQTSEQLVASDTPGS